MKPVNRIALIGLLTAVNVASRVYLQFLPNIKPVTTIIILATIAFGLMFGIKLAVTTVLVSGIIFGLGIAALFQIIAWCMIVLFTSMLNRVVTSHKIIIFAVWSFLCGYIFGFFVSLDKLFISPTFFLTYYLNGLTFDTLHAVGNLVFYPICYAALLPSFKRYSNNENPPSLRDTPF
jgi:energy-coupling factor transport system substrate-specific component